MFKYLFRLFLSSCIRLHSKNNCHKLSYCRNEVCIVLSVLSYGLEINVKVFFALTHDPVSSAAMQQPICTLDTVNSLNRLTNYGTVVRRPISDAANNKVGDSSDKITSITSDDSTGKQHGFSRVQVYYW